MMRGANHPRSALTLVELLVVITIMVLLLSISAPLFRRGVEDQKLREATRMVHGFIARAKSMAAANRRPVGVAIERLNLDSTNNAMTALQLFLMEVPPPYTGDIMDAVCVLRDMNHGQGLDGQWGVRNVDDDGNGTVDDISERGFPGSDDGDGMPETATFTIDQAGGILDLVKPGDFVRFNFRGAFYQINSIRPINPPSGIIEFDVVFFHPQTIWGNGLNGVFNQGLYGSDDVWLSPPAPQAAFTPATFQIYRRPERSLAQPLEMPLGTCIDLSVSGLGMNGAEFGSLMPPAQLTEPIIIMFSASGSVDSVYFGGTSLRPQQTIHLLVGKIDKLNAPEYDDITAPTGVVPSTVLNPVGWDDLNNDLIKQDGEESLSNLLEGNKLRWVSIGHRNGLVTVSENALVRPLPPDPNIANVTLRNAAVVTNAIFQAREFASEAQSFGGR